MARRRKRNQNPIMIVLIVLIVAIIAATGFIIKLCLDLANTTSGTSRPSTSQSSSKPAKKPSKQTEPPETEVIEPEHPVSSAVISVQGDLLMHRKVILANKTDDGYDFSSIFRYSKEYTAAADYAIANLETTLGGSEFPYQGSPAFNCPDDLADAAKAAGYDMLLTANNHCNDTLKTGIDRTLEQLRQRGITTLGTRLSADEKRFEIVDINGIRVGMVCYTYVMGEDNRGVCMNGENTFLKDPAQVNYFNENKLDLFYSEIQNIYGAMESAGAEATILFIHWGTEYQTSENSVQRSIAQKMCDVGFDVIIGGHPHVVQPMDLLTSSTNPDHKTVCIYSLGNAISNQLVEELTQQKSGHTEDGVLFTVSFEKYSDDTVYVKEVSVIPTWGYRRTENDKMEYTIVPLEEAKRDQWNSLYNLVNTASGGPADSYTRTMNIVSPGLQKVTNWLNEAKLQRDSDYASAVNPAA